MLASSPTWESGISINYRLGFSIRTPLKKWNRVLELPLPRALKRRWFSFLLFIFFRMSSSYYPADGMSTSLIGSREENSCRVVSPARGWICNALHSVRIWASLRLFVAEIMWFWIYVMQAESEKCAPKYILFRFLDSIYAGLSYSSEDMAGKRCASLRS